MAPVLPWININPSMGESIFTPSKVLDEMTYPVLKNMKIHHSRDL